MEQIDLQTITDVKELKALAYDQVAVLERTQANLRAIQARIEQVQLPVPKAK